MKVKQIVGEHTKGMRAKKYARKPVNTIAPKKPEAPKNQEQANEDLGSMTNTSGKVIANDGKTITVAMPDGTQIQKPITPDTMATDQQGKPVVNLATQPTAGAVQPQQSPQDMFAKGKDITVNTGKPVEEEGAWDTIKQGVKSALGMQSPEDIAKQDPTGQMAQLLKLRQQYAGTQYSKQIEDRIKNLQFRLNGGFGAPMGTDGEPKAVLPPDEFARQNPNFKESSELDTIKKLSGL